MHTQAWNLPRIAKVNALSEAMGRSARPASSLSRKHLLVSRRMYAGTKSSIPSTDRSLCNAWPTTTLPCDTRHTTTVRMIVVLRHWVWRLVSSLKGHSPHSASAYNSVCHRQEPLWIIGLYQIFYSYSIRPEQ